MLSTVVPSVCRCFPDFLRKMYGVFSGSKEKAPWQENEGGMYGQYGQYGAYEAYPQENSLDLSGHSTLPGRRSSIFNQFNQSSLPPWQNAAEDPLNLSRHSTLPGRRSSVYESFLGPVLEPLVEPSVEPSVEPFNEPEREPPEAEPRRRSFEPPEPAVGPEPASSDRASVRPSFFTGEDLPRRKKRVLPGHAEMAQSNQLSQFKNFNTFKNFNNFNNSTELSIFPRFQQ